MNFKNYANYYDLLYKDKDYLTEVKYIDQLIQKYSKKKNSTMLDVGCGTGRHATLLSQFGHKISGVDISSAMIDIAQKNNPEKNEYICASAQEFSFNHRYDVIFSLFHVMNYQTKNIQLEQAFNNINKHLNDDGIFIFDFWYGPAVLNDKPSCREKVLEDDVILVKRHTVPELLVNENLVKVNFDVNIIDKKTGFQENIKEVHNMRYFFLPELEYFLNNTGFSIIDSLQWLSFDKKLSSESWYGVIVAEKMREQKC